MKNKYCIFVLVFFIFPFVSSAHYIVGYVNDALDGTNADNHRVVLWNSQNGFQDNITGIIGPNGASRMENMYMLDCSLLDSPCNVGDSLSIKVLNNGDNYVSSILEFNVTSAGYDFLQNLTLNSPVSFLSTLVDDDINMTLNEIDLLANNTKEITCKAIVQEYDGDEILNVSSEFFSIDNSFFGDEDDNNYHYTNNSCILNQSFGEENQFEIICSYSIWYYANSENWKCEISLNDGLVNSSDNDEVFINPLLSIGVLESIDFGSLATQVFSDEVQIIVENKGNVLIDLALSGYGAQEGDGYAMICSGGENIGIENKKYSFNSFIGNLTLEDSEIFYNNLTSEPTITDFNLDFRKNDLEDNAINSTYWRIYVPSGSGGSCYGNIVLGAVMSE